MFCRLAFLHGKPTIYFLIIFSRFVSRSFTSAFVSSTFLPGFQAPPLFKMRTFDSWQASSIEEDNLEVEGSLDPPTNKEEDTATSQRRYDLEGYTTNEEIEAGLKEPPRGGVAGRRRRQVQWSLPRERDMLNFQIHLKGTGISCDYPTMCVSFFLADQSSSSSSWGACRGSC